MDYKIDCLFLIIDVFWTRKPLQSWVLFVMGGKKMNYSAVV